PWSLHLVMLFGQVICNGTPVTVTVNEHIAMLPAESVALHLTVVVPMGNGSVRGLPSSRVQTGVIWPSQSSVAVGGGKFRVAVHLPGSVDTVVSPGHVITGGMVSTMVTMNVHMPIPPNVSDTVSVMVCLPGASLATMSGPVPIVTFPSVQTNVRG